MSSQHAVVRGLVVAAVVMIIVAAAVTTGVLVALNRVPGMPVSGSTNTRLPANMSPPLLSDAPAAIVGATASCTSGPGVDSAGNRFTYEAGNAVDGQPDTAWRCDHDGVGASLLLTFNQPAVISWIGVVPGFAKIDPYDGTDRYLQGRKVSTARFVFDDGTYVEANFDTRSTPRGTQVVRFAPTTTAHVDMVVLASVPGSPTNGFGPTDKIAISDLTIGT
jgi:hypothetical protein